MRDILFQGKRFDGVSETGYFFAKPILEKYFIILGENQWMVHPDSVCQYTGMTEFVMTDKSIHAPLFEGDIVEVWSRRRTLCESTWNKPKSQYDIQVKARATIVFRHGKWQLDYDNNYNKSLCKLKGKEEEERTVNASRHLYDYGYHGGNEDWHREHNSSYKWDDIVKIGNKFSDPELLEAELC
jgi:hypothetical protein